MRKFYLIILGVKGFVGGGFKVICGEESMETEEMDKFIREYVKVILCVKKGAYKVLGMHFQIFKVFGGKDRICFILLRAYVF